MSMPGPTIGQIKAATAEHFGLSIGQLEGPDRSQRIAKPRQMAMWLSCKMTGCSLPIIGRAFGRRDHTTVMHARALMRDLILTDSRWHDHATQIERRVLSRVSNRTFPAAGD